MATLIVGKVVSESVESPDGTSSHEMPKGWRRIEAEEFEASKMGYEKPAFIEHRQFDWDNDVVPYGKRRIYAMLYWFQDKTGVAIHREWVGTGLAKGRYQATFFAFGCKHEYRELSRDEARAIDVYHGGSCYHVHQCKLCSHVDAYDSSD